MLQDFTCAKFHGLNPLLTHHIKPALDRLSLLESTQEVTDLTDALKDISDADVKALGEIESDGTHIRNLKKLTKRAGTIIEKTKDGLTTSLIDEGKQVLIYLSPVIFTILGFYVIFKLTMMLKRKIAEKKAKPVTRVIIRRENRNDMIRTDMEPDGYQSNV